MTKIEVTSAPSDPASDPDDDDAETNDGKDPEPSPAKGDIATITSSTSTFSTTSIEFDGLGNRNDNIAEDSVGEPNTGSWTFKVTYTVARLRALFYRSGLVMIIPLI